MNHWDVLSKCMWHVLTYGQFFRFAVVGVASNAILFLLYLGLTHLGAGHKLAMSFLYTVGIIQSFLLNQRWSFKVKNTTPHTFLRYFVVYAFVYVLNLFVLVGMVDWAGFPHQTVQGVMVLVCAVITFILQKFWVFDNRIEQPWKNTLTAIRTMI